jgi:hypothetical protein
VSAASGAVVLASSSHLGQLCRLAVDRLHRLAFGHKIVRALPREVVMQIVVGIVAIFAVIIVALAAYISTRPDDYRVERSAHINAPRDVVFSIINDLRQWGSWSPFEKRDPNMKKTFEGPSSGPGAIYEWNGNSDVGEGRLTIVDTKPGELVTMKLEFSRPFKCTNQVNFKLDATERGTRVSWIMDAKNNFMMKAMSLFMNMDKMVGKDFEQGLANLDTVAQAQVARVHATS